MHRPILPLPRRGRRAAPLADFPAPPPKLFRLPVSPPSLSEDEDEDIDDLESLGSHDSHCLVHDLYVDDREEVSDSTSSCEDNDHTQDCLARHSLDVVYCTEHQPDAAENLTQQCEKNVDTAGDCDSNVGAADHHDLHPHPHHHHHQHHLHHHHHHHHHHYHSPGANISSNKKKRKIPTSLRPQMAMPASSVTIGHISTSSSLYFIVDRHQSRLRLRRQLEHLHRHVSHHHFKPLSPHSTFFAADPLTSGTDVGVKTAKSKDTRAHKEQVKKESGIMVPSLKHFAFSFPSPISASIQYRHNLIAASVFPLPKPLNTHDAQRKSILNGEQFVKTGAQLLDHAVAAQIQTADVNAQQPRNAVALQSSMQSGALGQWQAAPPPLAPQSRAEDADGHNKGESLTPQTRTPRQRLRPRPKPGEPIWICQFCEFEDIFGMQPVYLMRLYDVNERRERKIKAERKRLLEKARMKGKKGRAAAAGSVAPNANANANSTITPETDEVPQATVNTPHDPGEEDRPHEIITDVHARDDDAGTATSSVKVVPTAAESVAPGHAKSKKAQAHRLKRQQRIASTANVV
ncbi:hypothetical protein V1517DRAFT_313288 [Lipomyces orientalis]|uniref:Uncharacterized protein n=1 Tax=Lipomyces orientalis TaxID=1233043 RepID=A0ACC3TXJ5_9ASCO